MKSCEQCRDENGKPMHGYYSLKGRLLRRAGGCNWLDWMAEDNLCPHCGGPVVWFQPAPAGQIMDATGGVPPSGKDA
jgi:hypothetical protein